MPEEYRADLRKSKEALSSEDQCWLRVKQRIPNWTSPDKVDATPEEVRSVRIRKQNVDVLLIEAEQELEETRQAVIAECRTVPAQKKLTSAFKGEYRGLEFIAEQLSSKFNRLQKLVAHYREDLKLIIQAEGMFEKHLEWKQIEDQRQKKLQVAKETRRTLTLHNREVLLYQEQVPKILDAVIENPLLTPASIIRAEGMDYIIGKKLKDFAVRRRWLLERGIPESEIQMPTPIPVPPEFEKNLLKIINRKIFRQERLARDPRWRRQEQAYRRLDAIAELERVEAEEGGWEIDHSPKTYRRRAGSGKMFTTDGRGRIVTTFRPGDEIVVTREEELPGWPHAADGWQLVEKVKEPE